MVWLVLVIALVLLVLGFIGSALKLLLWLGVILLVLWLIGWLVRPGGRSWYYW